MEENVKIFKKGFAYFGIITSLLFILEQNKTWENRSLLDIVAGSVVALKSSLYLNKLRKEEQEEIGEIKPYDIIGEKIILKPSEYTVYESDKIFGINFPSTNQNFFRKNL